MELVKSALAANDINTFFQETEKLRDHEELKGYFVFEKAPFLSYEALSLFESRIHQKIPHELKSVYETVGSFSLGGFEWNRLSLVPQKRWEKLLNNKMGYLEYPGFGILEGIQASWGGRPEIQETFTGEEIAEINRKYFIFGTFVHDDNFVSYLFFTDRGEFSYIDFDQDGYYKEVNSLESLRSESFQKHLLIDIFKLFLTRSMQGLLEKIGSANRF